MLGAHRRARLFAGAPPRSTPPSFIPPFRARVAIQGKEPRVSGPFTLINEPGRKRLLGQPCTLPGTVTQQKFGQTVYVQILGVKELVALLGVPRSTTQARSKGGGTRRKSGRLG